LTDWGEIVRLHGPAAYETAWRILGNTADVEDAVQESLLEAFRLHARQPVIYRWSALLRRIASFRALDILRKRRHTETLLEEPHGNGNHEPPDLAMQREQIERLRRAVADLPNREACVFTLRYFGEMSNTEIAAELEISTGAVAVALHKSRARIREALTEVER
jgi:RNA polymerase sigma-70 factor (ECF subfamily)